MQNGFSAAPFGREVCELLDLSCVLAWAITFQCLLYAYTLKCKIVKLGQAHAQAGPIALPGNLSPPTRAPPYHSIHGSQSILQHPHILPHPTPHLSSQNFYFFRGRERGGGGVEEERES